MEDKSHSSGAFDSVWINTILPNTLSILACIWFFMVLILSTSDCFYHFSTLFVSLHVEKFMGLSFQFIMDLALYFSTVWPAAIAYLIYNSLRDASLDPKQYLKRSLVTAVTISVMIKFITNYMRGKSEFVASFVLPLFLAASTGLSTYCYLKAIKRIRSLANRQKNPASSVTIRNLVFYSLVQFITILPSTVHNFVSANFAQSHQLAQNVCQFLLFLMGFINILVYFVLKNAGKKEGDSPTKYKGSYISLEATLLSSSGQKSSSSGLEN